MQFSISVSAPTRAEALEALEKERDALPDHESLKNQVIEHIAAYVDGVPADASGFSVSISAHIGYTLPAKE